MPSRDGHQDPFQDSSPSPSRPYSPQASPIPSNPSAYQQVGQGSSPNLSPSPAPNDARGSRFASSPLNPRPTPSPSRSGTRPTSPISSSGHGRTPDRSLSQSSGDGSAERDHAMRGVMAGSVGGGFTPYPVSQTILRAIEAMFLTSFFYSFRHCPRRHQAVLLPAAYAVAEQDRAQALTTCPSPHLPTTASLLAPVSDQLYPSLAIPNTPRLPLHFSP